MVDAVDQVMALEAACHRALRPPDDEAFRASFLEALASYKTEPLETFPRRSRTWSPAPETRQTRYAFAYSRPAQAPPNQSTVS
jgi:hypothetical protein